MDWIFLASDGASGGMLVMWYKRVVDKLKAFIQDYKVACSSRSVEDNILWAFTEFLWAKFGQ